MKNFIFILLAILHLLMLFNVALSQNNEAYIEQVGDENEAIVEQKGSNNGGFSVQQFNVILLQIDNQNVVIPNQAKNYHILSQYGSHIIQYGNFNIAKQEQQGKYSRNYILQQGNDHKAEVYQLGDHLVHSIQQYGTGCRYSIWQNVSIPIIVTQTH